MSAGRSYFRALRSDAGAGDLVGLVRGGGERKRLATAMLWTRRERRREEGAERGGLEPEDDSLEDDAVGSVKEGRGRGSAGRETFVSMGMLMTIMVAIRFSFPKGVLSDEEEGKPRQVRDKLETGA